MIDSLDEISEIPFEVFWDKFMDIQPGIYDQWQAKGQWLSMKEENRIMAFRYLAMFGTDYREPYQHLRQFQLPF